MSEFMDVFSQEIWESTYKAPKDRTLADTFKRVATAVASVEESDKKRKEWSEKFFDLLNDFKFTPGGRIYSNAGTEWKGTTLINCFVSPNPNHPMDSLEGILEILRDQALTLKSEGGWGHNFSHIRPRGSFIHGIGVETPGAVKYMEAFDKSSEIVTSGSGLEKKNKRGKGKIRKGAMMGVLDVWHPDIIEFITAKQTPGRLTKFNISVNCTNEFMNKILKVQSLREKGASEEEINEADTWQLRFPDTQFEKYDEEWDGNIQEWERKGYPVNIYKEVSATSLWNLIMESTYNRAEPGVLFLDRANKLNPLNYKDTIRATNPCGEQTLAPGGICCLGSMNLTQFVREDGKGFDFNKLKHYVRYAVRFLDNINTLSDAPLDKYIEFMRRKRRIGIGILGWASALYILKIRFASEKAQKLRDEVMQTIVYTAVDESVNLAIEKGMFAECVPEKHAESEYFKQINLPEELKERIRKHGIRNSSLFSIQPTGNTSIFANIVSGGLEPIFQPEYIRTVIVPNVPEHIRDVTPRYWEGDYSETEMFKKDKEGDEEILKGVDEYGVTYKIDKNRGLTKEVICSDYGVRVLKEKGEWDPKAPWAVSALSLSVQEHIDDLKGFSKWIDSAVSKTINIPHDYPFEQFKNVYMDAYLSGYIKGVTTYRAGTMTSVLSSIDDKKDFEEKEVIVDDVKLPASAPAAMKTLRAEGRKWYLTVVYHSDTKRPFALFAHTNHHEKNVTTQDAIERLLNLAERKGVPQKHIEDLRQKMSHDNNVSKICRAISLNLRHGVLIKNIVLELDSIENVIVGSFIFQVKKFLSTYIKEGETAEGVECQECSSKEVIFSEGCFKCSQCGSSKC